MRKQRREGRRDGRNAGGGAHGDREDIVHEEGRAGNQAGQGTEIIGGHDIRAAAGWVRVNRLPVGAGHRRRQEADGNTDGDRVLEGAASRPGPGREGFPPSRRPRRTSCPTQKMARAEILPEPLVLGLGGRHGSADQEALQDGDHGKSLCGSDEGILEGRFGLHGAHGEHFVADLKAGIAARDDQFAIPDDADDDGVGGKLQVADGLAQGRRRLRASASRPGRPRRD